MLIKPYWFDQRQLKAEPAGEDSYRISGTNVPERLLGIRKGSSGLFQAFMRAAKDSSEEETTESRFPTAYDAWEAAFELYRARVIL